MNLSEEYKDAMNNVLVLLEKQQFEIKWIPVSEKLPLKGEYVLASFDDGFVGGVNYGDDWELWRDSGDVVAWRPMPKPYEDHRILIMCPRCENEDIGETANFCKICGLELNRKD